MSFNVRIAGYRGIQQLATVLPKQYSADSVYVLVEPSEFVQKLTSNGATVVSSSPDASPATTLLRVEVADGNTIRYEIGPSGSVRVPGDSSQSLSGKDQFFFAPGWVLSFVDAANYP